MKEIMLQKYIIIIHVINSYENIYIQYRNTLENLNL